MTDRETPGGTLGGSSPGIWSPVGGTGVVGALDRQHRAGADHSQSRRLPVLCQMPLSETPRPPTACSVSRLRDWMTSSGANWRRGRSGFDWQTTAESLYLRIQAAFVAMSALDAGREEATENGLAMARVL